jgi:hypothetical protein
MKTSVPEVNPLPEEIAHNIARGIKKITDQTGKHKSIARMAKLTDLPENKLDQTVSKMSFSERKNIYRAFLDLQRVAQSVAKAEIVE